MKRAAKQTGRDDVEALLDSEHGVADNLSATLVVNVASELRTEVEALPGKLCDCNR